MVLDIFLMVARKTGDAPLVQPNLQPISAERYQGIPGAKITFSKPGAYQLELSGKPKNGASCRN